MEPQNSRSRFSRFAWGVLAYNILVVLWGAYVRATGSGAGCGARWPFCNGEVVPHSRAIETIIEFLHRVTSGIDTIAVLILCLWAFRIFARGSQVRMMAIASMILLLVEAALGAGLVLLRYVAHDQSAGRVLYLCAHLTNTMLLLAALTTTAWLAQSGVERLRMAGIPPRLLGTLPVALFVSVTGTVAALGDTLFPAISLSQGVQQDFAAASSVLLRLRLFHPILALLGAAYLIWAIVPVLKQSETSPDRSAAVRVLTLVLFQLAVGALNIALLAPVWMQLFHLFMADVLWISVLLMIFHCAAIPRPTRPIVMNTTPGGVTASR